jgi:hypothetical protein
MMNAGSLVVAGTVTEQAFIASELAFVSSTTNTVSVSVDFASWIRKPDGTYLILGNPTKLATTQYLEAAYVAVQSVMPGGPFDPTSSVVSIVTSEMGASLASYSSSLSNAAMNNIFIGVPATLPVPKRCFGTQVLGQVNSPKCDPYVSTSYVPLGSWANSISTSFVTQPWLSTPGAVAAAPLTTNISVGTRMDQNAWGYTISTGYILGGTWIHLNEVPWN